MVDMTVITRINKDTALYAALRKVMVKKKLQRLLDFTLTDDDPTSAFWGFLHNHTGPENKFSNGTLTKVMNAHEKLLDKQRKKIVKIDPNFEDRDKIDHMSPFDYVVNAVNESSEWKQIYKAMMVSLKTRLVTFVNNEFPHTPEYAAYFRAVGERDAAKLAREMELDRELDDFLGLTVAVAQNDTAAVNRLSRQLSDRHQPRRGKKFKPGDIVKKIKAKFGRKTA
ncbi:MAG: hypothetical protein AAF409_05230 [Pseudomonadota bacterium]